MATLNIKFDASTAKRFPVFAQYPAQSLPQSAYLELDIRDGSLDADYSGETGNAVPSDVWHNLVLRFKLMPETTSDQIAALIDEHKQTFQEILNGAEKHWNGNNWIGKFTDEANALIEWINHQDLLMCESEGGMLDLYSSFLEHKPFPENQSLENFAQEIIDCDGENGFYFREPYNIDSLLSDLRDQWADILYNGHEIPVMVAKYLIEHGTCDDSQWMQELTEFANAE